MNLNSRITVFLEGLGGGGAEQAIVTLMNAFMDRGYTVELILCKPGGVLQKQLSGKIKVIEFSSKNLYFCLPKLIKFVRDKKPDVLLTTLDLASIIALVAKRVAFVKTRVVIRVANTVSAQRRPWAKKKLEHLLMSWIYPWADGIVAVSNDAADDLARYANLPREHINCIYNPVITPRLLDLADERLVHPWFETGQLPVILGVGRLTGQKDFENLILAFSKVLPVHPSRLVILGEGNQRAKLESLVRKLNLVNMVSMPGFVDNPFQYMRSAAVFVLSSIWEGLPAVLIQALACGCPVVSTDCPSGPSEILAQGRYGRLVPVRDADTLADAIIDTLSESPVQPDNIWLKKFSLAQVVDQYLAILQQ